MFKKAFLIGALALSVLLVGAPPAGASSVVVARGALSDLAPTAANPTDGASAVVIAVPHGNSTFVLLVVRGLDRKAEGITFGAHVHVGPCVAGNGAAAGPHYNTGGPPSPTTEVWLDFTVFRSGHGFAITNVPFVIPPGGAGSVVIHAMPTDSMGVAGARITCLPVAF